MVVLIKNCRVFSPEALGKTDVLVLGDKIAAVGPDLSADFNGKVPVDIIDGSGLIMIPGLIDNHVHILGGGGEGGFRTRTPEAVLTDFTLNGITTVCGLLGTDGVTRNMASLVAKTEALNEEGITAYCYTGSYPVPITTLTGSVMKDIMLIDRCIGVGEIALSDHRSSQPTYEELSRLVADARVGGMLAAKAGLVDIHMGGGPRGLTMICRLIHETEIPYSQVLPTHINRSRDLFSEGLDWIKEGGYIDLTAYGLGKPSSDVPAAEGFTRILDQDPAFDHVTMSSDGQGSLPKFNEKGDCIGLGVGSSATILENIKDAVRKGLPLEKVIKPVTSNIASLLKLKGKGRIAAGYDADLVLLDERSLDLVGLVAKGRILVRDTKAVVKGTFEI